MKKVLVFLTLAVAVAFAYGCGGNTLTSPDVETPAPVATASRGSVATVTPSPTAEPTLTISIVSTVDTVDGTCGIRPDQKGSDASGVEIFNFTFCLDGGNNTTDVTMTLVDKKFPENNFSSHLGTYGSGCFFRSDPVPLPPRSLEQYDTIRLSATEIGGASQTAVAVCRVVGVRRS